MELTFTSEREVPDPLDNGKAAFSCCFAGPGGEEYDVPGFWDGGMVWKVRFTPTVAGTWTFATQFSDASERGLHGRKGTVRVSQPAEEKNPLYLHGGFLKVSPNRHFLTYTDGTPFFWLGDTWWFCPSDLMPIDGSNREGIGSTFKKLVDLRSEQGFNVVHWAFNGSMEVNGKQHVFNELLNGACFPAYWRKVDRYFAYANEKGLIPVFGFGWENIYSHLTLKQVRRLWRYVLARYGAYAAGFLICGEYNRPNLRQGKWEHNEFSRRRTKLLMDLGTFIYQTDPYKRAMTAHPWAGFGDKRQAWDQAWYGFIMLQAGHGINGSAPDYYRAIFNREPAKPFLEGEVTYEGIHGYDASVVRRNAYKALQCGSLGFSYGAHGLWYPYQSAQEKKFNNWGPTIPWWKAMKAPGAGHMKHMKEIYHAAKWWTLSPRSEGIEPANEAWVRADSAKAFLLYFPENKNPRSVVRLTSLPAKSVYRGTWYNPRTGVRTTLTSPLTAEASSLLLPHRPDEKDWVLFLHNE